MMTVNMDTSESFINGATGIIRQIDLGGYPQRK